MNWNLVSIEEQLERERNKPQPKKNGCGCFSILTASFIGLLIYFLVADILSFIFKN